MDRIWQEKGKAASSSEIQSVSEAFHTLGYFQKEEQEEKGKGWWAIAAAVALVLSQRG